MNEAPLLILVDGNSLVYRAFFAVPDTMTTSSGQPTNAVYGFTRMLLNLVRDHKPSKMAVAFDRAEPTFRHQRLDSYKATRDAMPEALSQQMNLVRQMIQTLGITAIDHFEVEADDIIATLASQARDQGHDVIVVTGDRDSYQLVQDPHIRVLYNKRGVSDYVLYDEAGILERTGVRPSDYVAYAALRGDTSDNLAGVDGVGEKTAAKVINSYGDIVGLYEDLDEQTPKLRQNVGDA
ncbi:MAG: DNA polymerase I, partial [bacterium]|nr:DNA polymerase I [bacterium]